MRDDDPVPSQDDVCPRCGGPLFRPALSRADASVYVCERCGQAEAVWAREHESNQVPGIDQVL